MAGFWDWMTGKEGGYETKDLLDPQQRALFNNVGSYMSKAYSSGGFPQYTGNYTAPLTGGEQENISRNARMSALGEQGLSPLLKGEFPEDYFQKSVYAPTMKSWKEDMLPILNESYAGPGGYWGSARAGAVGKSSRDVLDYLTSTRADLGYKAQQMVPQAVSAANQLSTTGAEIQSIPRIIQQYGLDKKYQEWLRTRPESADNINNALRFIDLTTNYQEYTPGSNSNWGTAGGVIGGGLGLAFGGPAGAALGYQLGSGIGGGFDTGGGGYDWTQPLQAYLSAGTGNMSKANAVSGEYPSFSELRKAYTPVGNSKFMTNYFN